MRRPPRAALVCAALALSACAGSGSDKTASETGIASGTVAIVDASGRPRAAYVASDRLYGLTPARDGARLAGAVQGPLLGTLAPVAVPLDERVVAYNAWGREGAAIRLYELAARRDSLLARDAFSVALRGDGALAYFAGGRPLVRGSTLNAGHVLVRRPATAPPRRWSERRDRYVVAAWARDRLLVYRLTARWPELVIFDGPRRARLLAEAAALVALSPDGRRALVATLGYAPAAVRVLDVADGSAVAILRLGDERVRWVGDSGSWVDGVAVAPFDAGVLVLRIGPRRLELEQVLRFEPEDFPAGVYEPRLDDARRRIVVWAELAQRLREGVPKAVLLDCDRSKLTCATAATGTALQPPRPVYDPSRP